MSRNLFKSDLRSSLTLTNIAKTPSIIAPLRTSRSDVGVDFSRAFLNNVDLVPREEATRV
jgi:hypothetical protein